MEGEVTRYMFQSVEIAFRVGQASLRGAQHFIAFLAALAKQIRTRAGEQSLNQMIKAGETIVIGTLPLDRQKEFKTLSKTYGLPYHSVRNVEDNTVDLMMNQKDLSKFNAVIERMGIAKGDVSLSNYEIEKTRESLKSRVERHSTKKNTTKEKAEPAARRIGTMQDSQIREVVRGINTRNMEYATSENWQAYLEIQALLYQYSLHNQQRIREQQPDATVVMSKSRWQELGRTISPDAQGIEITMPELVDGKKTGKFVDATVYDVSETTGADIRMEAYFVQASSEQLESITDSFIQQNEAKGVSIVMDETVEGDAVYNPKTKSIHASPQLSVPKRLKAIQRETILADCHIKQGASYSRDKNLHYANSITYTIGTKYGIDVSDITFAGIQPEKLFKMRDSVLRAVSAYSKTIQKAVVKTMNLDVMQR